MSVAAAVKPARCQSGQRGVGKPPSGHHFTIEEAPEEKRPFRILMGGRVIDAAPTREYAMEIIDEELEILRAETDRCLDCSTPIIRRNIGDLTVQDRQLIDLGEAAVHRGKGLCTACHSRSYRRLHRPAGTPRRASGKDVVAAWDELQDLAAVQERLSMSREAVTTALRRHGRAIGRQAA